jgi:hypothetical protein
MGAVERVYQWFFAPVDSRAMEIARIGFGVILLGAYLRYLPYLSTVFGPRGIGGYDTILRTPGFSGLAFQAFARFRVLDSLSSFAPVALLYVLLLASAACFALGVATRYTGALAAVLHLLFTARSPHLRSGWAWLLTPFLLYVAASGADAELSLAAWWRKRRGNERKRAEVSAYGMRLLQIHVATMYLVAGFERLDAPGWLAGDMVLISLVNTRYGRFDVDWFALRPVLQVVTWFVMAIEPLAPILLWIRPVARWFLWPLIAMHVGIELFIEVGWWQWLMLVALVVFFPKEWIERLRPRRALPAAA